jgi:hypothetical protein
VVSVFEEFTSVQASVAGRPGGWLYILL